MPVEKTNIKTSSIYSDDYSKRYVMTIEWNKQKKKAVVIMVSAGISNGISFDHTTTYVLENLNRLDYGSVKIVNLFATIGQGRSVIEATDDEPNLKYIINAVKETDTVIYATGTGHQNNKKFRKRQKELLEQLQLYEDKLMCITDGNGRKFFHPLYPLVREWELDKFRISELIDDVALEADNKEDKKGAVSEDDVQNTDN